MKSKFVALVATGKKAEWLRNLIYEIPLWPKPISPISLRCTFTMCHEAVKYLKKGGPGRSSDESGGIILNISATLHYTAGWYQIHVAAAKAAVDAITRNLALEWGTDYDIRVNGIAPGPINDIAGRKEEVKTLSRIVEKRSRAAPTGVPSSKL
ncbi:peroxisomal 2,4-dienoyl-CoA reductase [(3E)-enoyl-CoA-producing]-like [Bidens hawaiensis]|uniref:peroxisomal 2,4-dienoyl-CoA reductase [(3E)-enoyl-CoA-producing]-like n=1 Tax=Bidens hawaiensis TaxID=980011 RepID=UPI00404AD14A